MLDTFLFALSVALVAVTWAVVLVDTGMLLEPAQRWCREWWRQSYSEELDSVFWWKPFWGCARCVAGQWALFAYVIRAHVLEIKYSVDRHLLAVCAAIFLASLLQRFYQWTNS